MTRIAWALFVGVAVGLGIRPMPKRSRLGSNLGLKAGESLDPREATSSKPHLTAPRRELQLSVILARLQQQAKMRPQCASGSPIGATELPTFRGDQLELD